MIGRGTLLGAAALSALLCAGGCSFPTCRSALDCPSGQACVVGVCTPTGQTPCTAASDCSSGSLCANATCQPDCTVHGCPSSETCDATSHLCISFVSSLGTGGSSGGSTTGGSTGGGSSGGTSGGMDAGCTTTETWSGFAQSFFQSNCGCHTVGQPYTARPSFTNLNTVRSYGYLVVFVLDYGSMPPAGYGTVSPSDKQRILSWLNCGMPQ